MKKTMSWPIVPLGDVAEFRNGINYTKSNFGKGIKVVGVSDFQDYIKVPFDQLQEINPEGVVRKDNLLHEGDILFVRSNGNRELIGRSLFVTGLREDVTHSAFSIRLRFTSSQCVPRFYAYLFRSRLIRQALSMFGGGTNISNLNQGILEQLRVPLPPKPIQERISSILSAYDDLIENNTRRIAILEEVAQRIHEEWFTHFRFPGYEKVKTVESEFGRGPEKWPISSLGELISLDKGISYNGAGLTADGRPMANLKNVKAGGGFRRDATKPYSGEYKTRHIVRPGDIIIANTDLTQAGNVIGSPALIPALKGAGNILISHHIYAVRLNERSSNLRLFLYLILLSDSFKSFAKGHASGTTVLGLPREGILNFKIPLPPNNVIRRFNAVVEPLYLLNEGLERKIENLRATRDLLLPKLISGEIDVSNFPVQEPASI